MSLFLMQTRVSPEALQQPRALETLERNVADRLRDHCPEVRWVASYGVLGSCDYFDVFDAPNARSAVRVSVLVRTYGRCDAQVWPAFEWSDFKKILQEPADLIA